MAGPGTCGGGTDDITPWQQRAIMAAYKDHDRPARLASIGGIIGHVVTSTNALSFVEAQKVLAATRKAAK